MKSWKAPILCLTLTVCCAGWAAAQTFEPLESTRSAAAEDQSVIIAPATTPPVAPSNLQALAVETDTVFLVWQDNSNNESSFQVEYKIAGGTYQPVLPPNPGPGSVGGLIQGLAAGTTYFFRVRALNDAGNSAYSNEVSVTTRTSDTPCVGSATEMCLNNNRFRVVAMYQTSQGQSGQAHTVKLTNDSGYLWFFNEANIEAVVKVLNGCAVNNRYWVFAGGLTDVRVGLAVTDTQTDQTRAYVNLQGNPFLPIQDTTALQSCSQ